MCTHSYLLLRSSTVSKREVKDINFIPCPMGSASLRHPHGILLSGLSSNFSSQLSK